MELNDINLMWVPLPFIPPEKILIDFPAGWINEKGETVFEKEITIISVRIFHDPANKYLLKIQYTDSLANKYFAKDLIKITKKINYSYEQQAPTEILEKPLF